jgi:hypothetical protein
MNLFNPTTSVVLLLSAVLQALQIEDLERLASLPLAEAKYQKLTNVTLLEMLNEVFTYGATQVRCKHVQTGLQYCCAAGTDKYAVNNLNSRFAGSCRQCNLQCIIV